MNINSVVIGDNENPTLLLLHGWGHSIEITNGLGQLLASKFQVHLIDLPGHGKSEVPSSTWGMKDFAECINEYMGEKNISSAFFVGHSFGGKTILKLTFLFPEKVKKFVLINSSGIKPNRKLSKKIKFKIIGILRNILKFVDKFVGTQSFKNWFIPKFASPDYLNAGAMRAIFVKTVNEDLTTEIVEIDKECLLLWGEKDTETPEEMGRRFNKMLKNSKFVLLKGMDHVPFLGANAHMIAHKINKYLLGS